MDEAMLGLCAKYNLREATFHQWRSKQGRPGGERGTAGAGLGG